MPNEPKSETRVLLVGDVARLLKKSTTSIERLADCGQIRVLGRSPRNVRVFSAVEIEKLAASEGAE